MSTPAAVTLNGVARRFGSRWVLRGADLSVLPGEAVALMGKNGSGKTTLLRVIATLLRPNRGTGKVYGLDLVSDAGEIREQIGLLGHHAGLYDDLTAFENLRFAMAMSGATVDPSAIRDALKRVDLEQHQNERVRGFSAGMRRRLALARLLLRPPRLLLLDEPYAAFDAQGIRMVNQFARSVADSNGAVIVVTHDLERAHGTVDRVLRIEDGRIFAGATHEQISPDDHHEATAGERV